MHHAYPKTPRLTQIEAASDLLAVVEEKVDGANAAISFDGNELVLQSRGHVLSGGPREVQFGLFKQWANEIRHVLRGIIGDRYVVFGEWCYAKHRAFYDALPAYFLEFDVLDKTTGRFLSTRARQTLLTGSPITSIAVLRTGILGKIHSFGEIIGPSRYKTPRFAEKFNARMATDLGRHYSADETDHSILMEGIYIKIEDGDEVVGRMKLPRPDFEKIRTDDAKWLRRPIFPNMLAEGRT